MKQEVGEENEDEYNALFTKLFDEGINVQNSTSSTTSEDELKHIYSSRKNGVFAISYLLPSAQLSTNIPKVAVLKRIAKPNYDWIVIQMAMVSPSKVTVTCSDFKNDTQIKTFFDDCYKMLSYITQIHIFDTQCNLDHNKFNYIISKRIRVSYYTRTNKQFNKIQRKQDVQDKFGNSVKVFLLQPNKKAHGRRIIFDNIVITTDEDFWNLEVNSSDWSIDIQYSSEIATRWLLRSSLYDQA